MSLRSPLGRVIGLGSARSGSAHWYAQRVTAVALVLLGLWFLVALATHAMASREAVAAWLRWPANAVLMLLFVLVAAYHAGLGLQVIVEDYVGHKGRRTVSLLAIKFVLAVTALMGALAVLRIALGVVA